MLLNMMYTCLILLLGYEQRHEKTVFLHMLCFRYIESTIPFFLNTKFQTSSHLVWLYSLVCVRPGWKPGRPVFSQRGSYCISVSSFFQRNLSKELKRHSIDTSNGILMPYYDHDTRVVFLAGKVCRTVELGSMKSIFEVYDITQTCLCNFRRL